MQGPVWMLVVALCGPGQFKCEVPDFAAYPEIVQSYTQPACEMMAVRGGLVEVTRVNPDRGIADFFCMTGPQWRKFSQCRIGADGNEGYFRKEARCDNAI